MSQYFSPFLHSQTCPCVKPDKPPSILVLRPNTRHTDDCSAKAASQTGFTACNRSFTKRTVLCIASIKYISDSPHQLQVAQVVELGKRSSKGGEDHAHPPILRPRVRQICSKAATPTLPSILVAMFFRSILLPSITV